MDDYKYFKNKRADKIYLSGLMKVRGFVKDDIGEIREHIRPLRYISKVFDAKERHHFVKEGEELVIRITDGERQEVLAKVYEDTREINALTFQRYNIESGNPHKAYFTFIGDEIDLLRRFLNNLEIMPKNTDQNTRVDDQFLNDIILSKEQIVFLLNKKPELISEILENEITETEIINLGYRKKQISVFEGLLNDVKFFNEYKNELGPSKKDENVWQHFFERNTWIFGYGLEYIFNSTLDDKKLEQVTSGSSAWESGKRVDALLKSRGIINSLCFGEIKTHKTPLLKQVKEPYRKDCWAISDELNGGIVQIQKTVQKSIESIKTKTQIKDSAGDITGEELYLYHPKSFLIIGTHHEFSGEHGINESKYSSFELFRKNLFNPEVITFDELFERAKYIVEK